MHLGRKVTVERRPSCSCSNHVLTSPTGCSFEEKLSKLGAGCEHCIGCAINPLFGRSGLRTGCSCPPWSACAGHKTASLGARRRETCSHAVQSHVRLSSRKVRVCAWCSALCPTATGARTRLVVAEARTLLEPRVFLSLRQTNFVSPETTKLTKALCRDSSYHFSLKCLQGCDRQKK